MIDFFKKYKKNSIWLDLNLKTNGFDVGFFSMLSGDS